MYCKKCNVNIPCKTEVCPLCHSSLVDITPSDEEFAFPAPNVKKLRLPLFKKIYLALTALICVLSLSLNLALNPTFMWSVIIIVVLTYVYYFVSVTVFSRRGFHKRILGQTLILSLMFIILKLVVGGNHWIFIAWLPAVFTSAEIILCAFIIRNRTESPKYIMTLILLCVFGFLPIICAYVFDLSVKLPSVISSALSGLIIVLSCVAQRKTLLSEIKKVFHI